MRAPGTSVRRMLLATALLLAAGEAASARDLPLLGGRLRLAGELSGTIGPQDEGYFNYSDYDTSRLRLFRVDLAAELRLAAVASLLVDLRSDNLHHTGIYACYLRLTPWRERTVSLQAGLVPPVFGAYPRRRYQSDNPLPSVPLAYQYLTSLRSDAVPSSAEGLVAMRGRGWRVSYPVGSGEPDAGLPLLDGERFDTGAELRLGREPLSLALALTQGSPARPRIRDDNGGKQLAGRLGWAPGPAWRLGVSAATAEFLDDDLEEILSEAARGHGRQDALGADVEWSRGPVILRAEAVWSRFSLPPLAETRIDRALAAFGGFAEARWKLRPGLHAVGRVERLDFGRLPGELGSWDAPVTRVEVGAGYQPLRRLLLKASWQHNRRDGGRVRRNHLPAAQAVLWF